jgi:hypothetical protein
MVPGTCRSAARPAPRDGHPDPDLPPLLIDVLVALAAAAAHPADALAEQDRRDVQVDVGPRSLAEWGLAGSGFGRRRGGRAFAGLLQSASAGGSGVRFEELMKPGDDRELR